MRDAPTCLPRLSLKFNSVVLSALLEAAAELTSNPTQTMQHCSKLSQQDVKA